MAAGDAKRDAAQQKLNDIQRGKTPRAMPDDLNPDGTRKYSQTIGCVMYARGRAPGGIGPTGGDLGAYNLIYEGEGNGGYGRGTAWDNPGARESNVQRFADVTDLRSIREGDAILWDRDAGMNKELGHIAVIEKVFNNGVVISQAGVPGDNEWVFKSFEDLHREGIYVLSTA